MHGSIRQQHLEEHLVPDVDGAGQAPVHAVVVQRHVLVRPVAVPARVPVRPEQHRRHGVHEQQPRPRARGFRLRLRPGVLLHLRRVEVEVQPRHARLVGRVRPRPPAVAALVPLPALEVRRRRQRPHDRRPAEPRDERAERRAEREVRHPGDEAVVAADDAAAGVVEHGAPGEPVRRREDDVVGARDPGQPGVVRLVEVEVPQIRRTCSPSRGTAARKWTR
jgi:hypothetical protein